MEDSLEKKLQELIDKVNRLASRQLDIQREIQDVQKAIYDMKHGGSHESPSPFVPDTTEIVPPKIDTAFPKQPVVEVKPPAPRPPKIKTPIEEFIGTNLLNKIGIAILVLGISYGVKYSIDHELINPLTRIILGYIAGGLLILVALRLKKNYPTFSAVLLSGGMAAIYFITYVAYDFYGYLPQLIAFGLMVLFTAATVYAALLYNLQVIAIIGLVGAYGVPFLLSNGSGQVSVLFSYMSIINGGILFLSFRKSWRQLYYVAFALTWIIFGVWWFEDFNFNEYVTISLVFATIFFVIFYSIFLAYKIIRQERFGKTDVSIVLANSFFHFWFGYYSIMDYGEGERYVGLFTVFHGCLHLIACLLIYWRKEQHRDVFFFVAGMVLVFFTMAVPIQLDGNWVTLIWAGEAVVLFFVGRTKSFPVYERLSYPVILLTFISALGDWEEFYQYGQASDPHSFLLNIQFFSSLLICAAFGCILWLHLQPKYSSGYSLKSSGDKMISIALSALVILTIYLTFYNEVQGYWERLAYAATPSSSQYSYLKKMETLWLINYSAVFGILLSMFAFRLNDRLLTSLQAIYNSLILASFVTISLMNFASLRDIYLQPGSEASFLTHIGIRYVSMVLVLPLMWINVRLFRKDDFGDDIRVIQTIALHLFIIILLSSELISALDMSHIDNSDKLALSILWASYALGMIVWGLRKSARTMRIMAMVVFGVTLLKLFLYDISGMSTIAKTVVMMTLGAILLVASFLYNRVKKSSGPDPTPPNAN